MPSSSTARLAASRLVWPAAAVWMLSVLLGLGLGRAHAGRPTPSWRTIDTPHFQVHYPLGLEPVAYRTARICEEAHLALTPVLRHKPTQRTQVVVSDFGDSANGSATAIPSLEMNVYAAPPNLDGNLNDYDDWLRVLVYHEYAHILHLDTVSGLPELFNKVLGRSFALNQNMPSMVIEGTAVWLESRTSARGRIRSAWFRGWLRAAALDGTLAPLDVAVHAPLDFPGPNVWYMYGGHFVDWLARTHGEAGLARVFEAYGDDVMPFALNAAFIEGYGLSLVEAWNAWQEDLRRRSASELDALRTEGPPTPWRRLTETGQRHEDARFFPDGRLAALELDGDAPAALWVRSPEDDFATRRKLLELDGTDHFDVCSDGSLVLDRVDRFDGLWSGYDLYRWRGRALERVTRGARIREPACGPDGRFFVGVQVLEGRTRLVRVDAADGAVRVLADPGGLGQVAFPAVSPDGRWAVATALVDTRRTLWLVDLETGDRRALTDDDALSIHARFTPDGRAVLYASDRSGVLEVYRRDLDADAAVRLTRTVTGVTGPALSPDGRYLVASLLVSRGEDLAVVPTAGLLAGPQGAARPVEAIRPDVGAVPLPSRPYAPLETLAPVAWSPAFALSSPEDTAGQVGLLVEAADAVGRHIVFGDFNTLPAEQDWRAQVAYAYRGLTPSLNATVARTTRIRPGGAYYTGARHDWRESISTLALGASLPFSRAGHSASASMRYVYERLEPLGNPTPTFDPLDRAPAFPSASAGGNLVVGLSWSSRDSALLALSSETGGSANVTLRLRDPMLAGEASTAEVFWDTARFVDLWGRHVLALRLSGAVGVGDDVRGVYYALSPAPERNLLLDALDQIYFGSTYLRGFPTGTVAGSRYLLGTAEYRLPVFDLYRGFGTAPVFGRNVTFAAFTDWAQARERDYRLWPNAFRKSFGLEVAARGVLGWRLPVDARLGAARGLGADGETQFYFFLGPWF